MGVDCHNAGHLCNKRWKSTEADGHCVCIVIFIAAVIVTSIVVVV